MTPDIAILIGQALIKYGPSLARELMLLFSKKEITNEDWNKIFELSEKSYNDYVKPPSE